MRLLTRFSSFRAVALPSLQVLVLLFAAPLTAQPYTQISAGEFHTCALLDSGGVHCWGDNFRGQLGDGMSGSGQEQPEPQRVLGISTAAHIAAGASHNCAALRDGRVQCWGSNFRGQLGDGSTSNNPVPVFVVGVADAVAVAAGLDHSCALRQGGGIKCWGYNGDGELGNGSAVFYSTSVVDVSGISTATALSAGNLHTCALLANNRVRCWGGNNYGALGDGTFSKRDTPVEIAGFVAQSVEAGWWHTCATYNGVAYCWGDNTNGILGNGNTTDSATPVQVQGINTVTAIAAGEIHTCARRSSNGGEVDCWGNGTGGRIGQGNTTNTLTPLRALGNDTFSAVTAGRTHTCALTTGGSAKCWGRNDKGQIGTTHFAASGDDHSVPQFVAPRCELDVDGDGIFTATTDGVLSARALAGMSGNAVTAAALGSGATRTTWPQIRNFLIRACGVTGLAP